MAKRDMDNVTSSKRRDDEKRPPQWRKQRRHTGIGRPAEIKAKGETPPNDKIKKNESIPGRQRTRWDSDNVKTK